MKNILLLGLFFVLVVSVFSIVPQMASADCFPFAYRQCISNIAYWYNTCGAIDSIAQNCNTTGQICQNGQCITKTPTDTSHYQKKCYNNNLYWYSKNGVRQEIAKNCNDNNSCTKDACTASACTNTVVCDGSTCTTGSQDYTKSCTNNNQNQNQNQNQNNQNSPQTNTVSLSLLAQRANDGTWTNSLTVAPNDTVNFMVVIKNISSQPVDAAIVKVDLTDAIVYSGDLKINGLMAAGDLGLGVNLGTLDPKSSKLIAFSGTVANNSDQRTVQIVANTGNSTTTYDSDYLNVTINQGTPSATTTNNILFGNIKKNWVIWFIVVIILIVVFVIIFRRLSSNV